MPSLDAQLKTFKQQAIAYNTGKFITQDADCLRVLEAADKLSHRPESVLITGESGTGKELVAERLHGRRTGRFIALNLSAMPDALVQAELFGHVKGSYSGATSSRMGLLVAASRGTLFLDEIGDITPALQVMLLRLIETRKFRRIGENEDTAFTGRFIFATNCLGSDFRDDLYHRIATFRLKLKPLRERMKDARLILKNILTDAEYEDFIKLLYDAAKASDCVSPVILGGNVRELLRLATQYKVLGPHSLDFHWEGDR
jgi:transcriptional regulator with PAS, ATPase and Fis domain